MSDSLYPQATPEIAAQRKKLAPKPNDAFEAFSKAVFEDGALDGRTKQLVAVAVAHVTQCPYCIKGHTRLAPKAGASDEQIMEAIWAAAEMRAGGGYAHTSLALATLHGHKPAHWAEHGRHGRPGRTPRHRHRCDEVRPGRSPGHSPSMISALDCVVFSTLVMTSSDFSRVPTPTAKTMAVTMKHASSPQPKVSNPRLSSP